jgi:hypothetical protein
MFILEKPSSFENKILDHPPPLLAWNISPPSFVKTSKKNNPPSAATAFFYGIFGQQYYITRHA